MKEFIMAKSDSVVRELQGGTVAAGTSLGPGVYVASRRDIARLRQGPRRVGTGRSLAIGGKGIRPLSRIPAINSEITSRHFNANQHMPRRTGSVPAPSLVYFPLTPDDNPSEWPAPVFPCRVRQP